MQGCHQIGNNIAQLYGITKREYFAAMAMQGVLACYPKDIVLDTDGIAADSVELADALINELNKVR